MKLSLRQDIMAPIGFVFERAADFSGHERQAIRRGVSVERLDEFAHFQCGSIWNARFKYRGKQRVVAGELIEFADPDGFLINTSTGGLKAVFDVELVALARERTRMKVGLDMRPETMKARLFLQSLKLAKARLDRKFRRGIGKFARDVEAEFGVSDMQGRGL